MTLTVPGKPVGKQRPRFAGGHAYTPKPTVEYERLVRVEYQKQNPGAMFPAGVPLDMRITAYFQVPKSAGKSVRADMLANRIRPTKIPDSTNIAKAIEDGLNGVAYPDDCQIVDTQIRRFYGEEPRVDVTIQEAEIINQEAENEVCGA